MSKVTKEDKRMAKELLIKDLEADALFYADDNVECAFRTVADTVSAIGKDHVERAEQLAANGQVEFRLALRTLASHFDSDLEFEVDTYSWAQDKDADKRYKGRVSAYQGIIRTLAMNGQGLASMPGIQLLELDTCRSMVDHMLSIDTLVDNRARVLKGISRWIKSHKDKSVRQDYLKDLVIKGFNSFYADYQDLIEAGIEVSLEVAESECQARRDTITDKNPKGFKGAAWNGDAITRAAMVLFSRVRELEAACAATSHKLSVANSEIESLNRDRDSLDQALLAQQVDHEMEMDKQARQLSN
jgi:hypothetical protein